MKNDNSQQLLLRILLTIHAIVLVYLAAVTAPTVDEYGHLPSGIHYWITGRTDAYRVNPPLVRIIAAIPMMVSRPDINYNVEPGRGVYRSEGVLGYELLTKYKLTVSPYLFFARLFCIPFSLLGAWIVTRWAQELAGFRSGIAALLLWSFDPNILTNAVLITPDVGATALGVTLWYVYWKWIDDPSNDQTVLLGISLGLALLTKFTWLVAIPLIPLLFIVHGLVVPRSPRDLAIGVVRSVVALVIAFIIINGVYGFVGCGHTLSGSPLVSNKFLALSETILRHVPIPLPSDFTMGLDRQFLDLETRRTSYLNGEWRDGGWLYYYLESLVIKTPLALFPLLFISAARGSLSGLFSQANFRALLSIVVPGLAILLGVSLNLGFNRHLRYVLPSLPFIIIGASLACSKSCDCKWFARKSLPYVFVMLFCLESIWCFPHTASFFNLAVGGPHQGFRYLTNSNVDWGQDLIRFQEWREQHPEIKLEGASLAIPNIFIDDPPLPLIPNNVGELTEGWFAISLSRISEDQPSYKMFRSHKPEAFIGYSIQVYRVTSEMIKPKSGLDEETNGEKSRL